MIKLYITFISIVRHPNRTFSFSHAYS
ncbi:hypothetical protein TSAR_000459 [Trichomalopsis sarcophagae]|uniref:Uncharacterized protein n=1 Tax=Trichomalopsis sarcophagae TaxID=543379 RepID=A0A232ES50_9HYME|nr:hypothetical protein TSAR_000459 [Trichomalopsis sarcophagae]